MHHLSLMQELLDLIGCIMRIFNIDRQLINAIDAVLHMSHSLNVPCIGIVVDLNAEFH